MEEQYSMRGDSVSRPIKFNDSEKFIEEENKHFSKVYNPKPIQIQEAMKWENLYFDEIEDYAREQCLIILFSAIIIMGRMIL